MNRPTSSNRQKSRNEFGLVATGALILTIAVSAIVTLLQFSMQNNPNSPQAPPANTTTTPDAYQTPQASHMPSFEPSNQPSPSLLPPPSTTPPTLPSLANNILAQCFDGAVAFRHPSPMKLNESTAFAMHVAFENSTIGPAEGLPGEGEVIEDSPRICEEMKAELTGPGFDIKPTGGTVDVQIVPEHGYAEWIWDVTPKESGTKKLYLTLYTSGPNDEKLFIKSYSREIEVDVSTGDAIADVLQKFISPLGVTAALIFAALAFLFKNVRRAVATGFAKIRDLYRHARRPESTNTSTDQAQEAASSLVEGGPSNDT